MLVLICCAIVAFRAAKAAFEEATLLCRLLFRVAMPALTVPMALLMACELAACVTKMAAPVVAVMQVALRADTVLCSWFTVFCRLVMRPRAALRRVVVELSCASKRASGKVR